ncbi:hypothetical protein [Achromobacter arsenitoxydans]|uniref:Uncharacterized protein n=1 Tax=Achromobacter arsenitoxydans SY8 TaxID=477184 RepID=H0FCR9_9BURK|nr:hypothetical protein [Achromobacter arsenitoxydans]EHK64024.1 hypothetical protein KYC_22891 [Achromobacter arsenitoxydans SY8]
MPKLLPRVLDLLLLSFAAALFGACLTSMLTTGAYGWAIPDAPYLYEPRDFYAEAVMAGLVGVIALALAERPARLRQSGLWRAVATFVAALIALCLAPPSPQVFGNTWAPGEATRELFLAQLHMVLPIALAATVLRWGLQRVLR